jgi:hypothetical protein
MEFVYRIVGVMDGHKAEQSRSRVSKLSISKLLWAQERRDRDANILPTFTRQIQLFCI